MACSRSRASAASRPAPDDGPRFDGFAAAFFAAVFGGFAAVFDGFAVVFFAAGLAGFAARRSSRPAFRRLRRRRRPPAG